MHKHTHICLLIADQIFETIPIAQWSKHPLQSCSPSRIPHLLLTTKSSLPYSQKPDSPIRYQVFTAIYIQPSFLWTVMPCYTGRMFLPVSSNTISCYKAEVAGLRNYQLEPHKCQFPTTTFNFNNSDDQPFAKTGIFFNNMTILTAQLQCAYKGCRTKTHSQEVLQ